MNITIKSKNQKGIKIVQKSYSLCRTRVHDVLEKCRRMKEKVKKFKISTL